jgi:hypothetical protein
MMIVDLVEHKRSARRQLETPKMPLVDDLPNYISLVFDSDIPPLKPEHFLIKKDLYENPALVVLKEETTTQRLKQEVLETKMEEIVQTQSTLMKSYTKM